jgi:hypothetical protein
MNSLIAHSFVKSSDNEVPFVMIIAGALSYIQRLDGRFKRKPGQRSRCIVIICRIVKYLNMTDGRRTRTRRLQELLQAPVATMNPVGWLLERRSS